MADELSLLTLFLSLFYFANDYVDAGLVWEVIP